MSDPLIFDVNLEINTRLLLIWLSFVGIHVYLLLFALLTYSQVKEVRTLNLEASTRYKIRTAGTDIFEIWPTSHYVKIRF